MPLVHTTQPPFQRRRRTRFCASGTSLSSQSSMCKKEGFAAALPSPALPTHGATEVCYLRQTALRVVACRMSHTERLDQSVAATKPIRTKIRIDRQMKSAAGQHPGDRRERVLVRLVLTWSKCLTMSRFFLSARCSTGTRSPWAICCVAACTWSLRSGARRPSARESNDPRDLVIVITYKSTTTQTHMEGNTCT